MIVFEATRFVKLQGIRQLNPLCFACFNPPSTSQRLNSLGSSSPDGLYMFPWLAGLLTRSLTSCALGWENLRWKFQTTLFLRNKPHLKFSLQVFAAGFASLFRLRFRLRFSPAFFACVFRLSFRFSFRLEFRNQAIELDAACSTRALALIVPFLFRTCALQHPLEDHAATEQISDSFHCWTNSIFNSCRCSLSAAVITSLFCALLGPSLASPLLNAEKIKKLAFLYQISPSQNVTPTSLPASNCASYPWEELPLTMRLTDTLAIPKHTHTLVRYYLQGSYLKRRWLTNVYYRQICPLLSPISVH